MKIHADILRALADGKQIQTSLTTGGWINRDAKIVLNLIANESSCDYRIKPQTININGFEVPEPMREEPEHGSSYWLTDPLNIEGVNTCTWYESATDKAWLSLGVCHLTEEAAKLHAEALLSFTRKEAV